MTTFKKIWNLITSAFVAAAVLLAVVLVGVRVVGLTPFVVLSGSMEPTYQTGSLIFVKKANPFALEEGQVITYMISEDTVVTHRMVGIVPDEEDPSVIRFRTKGDANDVEDGTLVHYKNVIGTPVFTIPYVGYISDYLTNPPGMYIGIMVLGIVILLMFAPDILRAADKADKKAEAENAKREVVAGK